MVDYHRPTTTKDDWGGWNGPCTVVENDPERGQAVVLSGNRRVRVHYPNLRHCLYVETFVMKGIGSDHTALGC
eukprot:175595-Pyramimonas_sp.AAC.1